MATNFSDSPDPPIWMIYAFGGGMGHLTRGLSLARHAARNGICTRVLSNSPFLPAFQGARTRRLIELDPLIEVISFPAELGRDDLSTAILRQIQRCDVNDVLIVDTFPRGIAGELAMTLSTVPALKVLVHRDLNPVYVRQANLDRTISEYDAVILPGENVPRADVAHFQTEPWTICDSQELLCPEQARSVFGIDRDNPLPLIMIVGSGNSVEAIEAGRLARQLNERFRGQIIVRFASLDETALKEAGDIAYSVWPLFAALKGVDLLIGAGGYHTVYEARATAIPFVGIPQPRLYDRQAHRLHRSERVSSFDELVSVIQSMCANPRRNGESRSQPFGNGAEEAFEMIRNYHPAGVKEISPGLARPRDYPGKSMK